MVAVPLIFGRLTAADYEDDVASDPRIDRLRDKMECVEDKRFSADYLDPDKRSIANAITIEFKDGSKTREVVVEYPIGHRRRRKEGIPVLVEKFRTNLARRFPAKQQQAILDVALDAKKLEAMPVHEFVDLMVDLTAPPPVVPMPHLTAAALALALAAALRPPLRRLRRRTFPKLKSGLWEVTTTAPAAATARRRA